MVWVHYIGTYFQWNIALDRRCVSSMLCNVYLSFNARGQPSCVTLYAWRLTEYIRQCNKYFIAILVLSRIYACNLSKYNQTAVFTVVLLRKCVHVYSNNILQVNTLKNSTESVVNITRFLAFQYDVVTYIKHNFNSLFIIATGPRLNP